VVILASKHGATELALLPAARDFVTDAYAHCKFIGHAGDAAPLFEAAGLSRLMDAGFINLDEHSAAEFFTRCGQLRFWPRQAGPAESAAQ
jgi:catalase